ncbi:EpsG family protein [Caballeronia sp. AZ10_KS36]|uniref:EpsG family protein n=1 Tax=Caballeronia sp. AZ10_KS36 TaxID=2921757 RepID=UPI002027F264|nr:EpsG family protein [Caballeronia sp. AZ10_KS36]
MKARAMRLNDAQASRTGHRAPNFFATPSGWAYIAIALVILYLMATSPREVSTLLDQDNYLEYFRRTTWDWFVSSYHQRTSTLAFVISTVTEEFGWRAWVVGLNALGLSPDTGVRVTVVLLNTLIFIALLETRRPLIGLCLWAVVPMALATVGTFQIRQGMGFSIAMLLSLRYQRPLTGWALASFVHTTFAVPALLLVAIRACGDRRRLSFVCAGVTAIVLVSSAGFLFRNFGGRRIDEYANYQNDFTMKLVVLLVVYMTASIVMLYSEWKNRPKTQPTVWTELATMHIVLVFYLVLAFALFPFGKGRVWYCVQLLLPFIVAQIRFRNAFSIWWIVGVLLVLSAEIIKSSFEGVYAYFIGS